MIEQSLIKTEEVWLALNSGHIAHFQDCNVVDVEALRETEEVTVIATTQLQQLKDRAAFLDCLEIAGVDNWVGYGDAQEIMGECDD